MIGAVMRLAAFFLASLSDEDESLSQSLSLISSLYLSKMSLLNGIETLLMESLLLYVSNIFFTKIATADFIISELQVIPSLSSLLVFM